MKNSKYSFDFLKGGLAALAMVVREQGGIDGATKKVGNMLLNTILHNWNTGEWRDDPKAREFVTRLVQTGVVRESDVEAFEEQISAD